MDMITIERETLNAAMMALEYLLEASPVMTTKHRDAYSTAARLRAALAAQPAPAAVPPGYAVVPIEPTQEMLTAMQSSGWMVGNYRAMIAAAGDKP